MTIFCAMCVPMSMRKCELVCPCGLFNVYTVCVSKTIQKQEAVMIKHESRAFVCLFLCVH